MNNLSILTPEVLTISGVLAISLVAFIISLSGTDSSQVKNGLNLFGCLFLPEVEGVILVIMMFLTPEKVSVLGCLIPVVFIVFNIICMLISANKNTMRKVATMISCGISCLVMLSCTMALFGISCQSAMLPQSEISDDSISLDESATARITVLSYDNSAASEEAVAGIKSAAEEMGITDSLVFENANADPAEMHNMCDELDTSSERYIVIIPSHKKGIPKNSASVILYDKVSNPTEIGYETLMSLELE